MSPSCRSFNAWVPFPSWSRLWLFKKSQKGMWGTLKVFIHLNMSRNKAFAWSDNDALLSCDRLMQIVILNHSLLFSWMCWSLPWLHLLHYILLRGYTDSLQQENGIEQRELLTEFPWNVLIWLKHMVESGNCLSISLIFKNCSYLCSPVRWWGNHSAGESSELLSGHTTDRINSVDFFFSCTAVTGLH